jgi:hypothetical protein
MGTCWKISRKYEANFGNWAKIWGNPLRNCGLAGGKRWYLEFNHPKKFVDT